MGGNEAYKILIRASLSYAWKKHPYMTAWVTVCIFTGVCMGIANASISDLLMGIVTGILPMIVTGIGRAVLSLDRWERRNFDINKMRRREAFVNYIKEYTEKSAKK